MSSWNLQPEGAVTLLTLARPPGCIAGALPEEEYLETIRKAGFATVEVLTRQGPEPGHVYSISVRAGKPAEVTV